MNEGRVLTLFGQIFGKKPIKTLKWILSNNLNPFPCSSNLLQMTIDASMEKRWKIFINHIIIIEWI